MTTGDAMLRAILEEPAADDLRLIYADWLTDHGEPERAEFIRLQVQIAAIQQECLCQTCAADCHTPTIRHNGPCLLDRRDLADLYSRMEDLWYQPGRGFLYPCGSSDWSATKGPEWNGDGGPLLYVRRGFAWKADCHLDHWKHEGPTLVAAHPVEAVRLTDCEPDDWGPEGHPDLPGPATRYGWVLDNYSTRPERVPAWLFYAMLDLDVGRCPSPGRIAFATKAEAHAAHNLAALNWARSKVQPPLLPLKLRA